MNRFRPNRFRIIALLLGLAVLAGAGFARALEFSGPIVVSWNDDLLCGAVVPTADGARQQVVVGTSAGWVRLLRPSTSVAENFGFAGQLFAQGRVVAMAPWEGRAAGSPGVVVCTANPDRVIFAELTASYPYFNRVGSVDLVEDPGSAVFLDDAGGTLGTIAVSLPGIDQIALLTELDGTWSLAGTLPAGDRPTSLVALNLDEDAERELVAVNQGALSRSLGRYDRLADGSYGLTRTLAVDGAPRSAQALDWDGDGLQEVFVSLTDSARIVAYDASGLSLVERTRVDLPFTPGHFSLAGGAGARTDIFTCAEDLQLVDHRTAPGGLDLHVTYYPGGPATAVLNCDFNGDTLADLAVLGGEGQYASVLYGKPDGTHWGFPALDLPSAAGPTVMADLDGDGRRELAVVGLGQKVIARYDRAPDGGFEYAYRSSSIGFLASALAAIQLDADPARELAAYDPGAGRVVLYKLVEGVYAELDEFEAEMSWSGLIAADLDGDGLDDLLGYSRSTRSIAAYFGLGGGSFSGRVDWTLGQPIHELQCLDLDEDGRLDLVHSDGISKVWFATNPAGRALVDPGYVYAGAGASELAAGDLDFDGDADIVVGNRDDDSITMIENPGTGVLIRRVGSMSLLWSFDDVICVDVDGSGAAEVLLLQRARRSLGISFALGDWQFSPASEYPLFSTPYRLLTVDREQDGALDLVALDNLNGLGYVLPNAERVIVATDEPVLRVRCAGEELEILVRPEASGDWRLDFVAGPDPLPLAGAGGAWIGTQDYERGQWRHRVPVAALVGLDRAADPRLRWTGEGIGGPRTVEIAIPPGCGTQAASAPGLAWVRLPGPNPFNPRVSFAISLARAEELTVDVFDLAGRHVRRLAQGRHEPGEHVFVWQGEGPRGRAAAGAYFVLAQTESQQLISKVLLLK